MKGLIKKISVIGLITIGFSIMSCNQCAKCTEPNTGITDEYCGKKISVETYATGLRNQGWTCTVD